MPNIKSFDKIRVRDLYLHSSKKLYGFISFNSKRKNERR